MLDSFHKY